MALLAAGCRSQTVDAEKLPTVTLVAPTTTLDPTQPVQVGQLVVPRCDGIPGALCAALSVPLDRARPEGGTIGVAFLYFPARDQTSPALGTIVAVEGGPGYSTTANQGQYVRLFQSLLDHRNLLLVDNRGTGHSSPLECDDLQALGVNDAEAVRRCGVQLGSAAADYSTAASADDLAAIVQALGLGRVDIFGDSYGSFFAQSFAGRHPDLLRTVVLDSTYPARGDDPWFASRVSQAKAALDRVCEQAPSCVNDVNRPSDRLAALADSLRRHPVDEAIPAVTGSKTPLRADVQALISVLLAGATNDGVYRELDAAARAWLAGDHPPLLRLIAESPSTGAAGLPVGQYSLALNVAVTCNDYPLLYDRTAPPGIRRFQLADAMTEEEADHPTTFAPFTVQEWVASPAVGINTCLDWPAPQDAPLEPIPDGKTIANAPTLVLSGELDSLTTPAEGQATAALFTHATPLLLRNSTHANAVNDLYGCASAIVVRFISDGVARDTTCTDQIPPVRPVTTFAATAAGLRPADPADGDASMPEDRQVASAAAAAVGDALAQWLATVTAGGGVATAVDGHGLRGGSFHVELANTARVTFKDARFTADVAVNGTATWDFASGQVQATLVVTGGGVTHAEVQVSWNASETGPVATVVGTADGRAVKLVLPAP